MYGHNPEDGHECPTCKVYMICTIEDGLCENKDSSCDRCYGLEIMHTRWFESGGQGF